MLGAFSAGALVHPLAANAQAAILSLKEIARSRGILFGSSSDPQIQRQDPAYGQLFAQQCAIYVPKIAWTDISPKPGMEDFGHDPNIAWAIERKMVLSGAHLLWFKHIPDWVSAMPSNQEFAAAVLSRVRSVCHDFPAKVWSWNVVNEAINPADGRPDGLRNSEFLQRMGPGFFEPAFREARKAAPQALLAYNDDGFEIDSPTTLARRAALLRLLEMLKSRNVPIDAIGLQTHIHASDWSNFNDRNYARFLSDISTYGVRIMISELDVNDMGTPHDIGKRDRVIADIYKRILSIALDQKATVSLVTWGLMDQFSWYNLSKSRGYMRPDNTPQRPLLFDEHYQPTPAFYALADALKNAPARPLPSNY